MSLITTFPTELWQLILCHSTSQDKARLALVSRSMHALTLPALYGEIDWEWKKSRRYPPIHLLLRTAMESPDLAKRVTCVRFTGSFEYPIWEDASQPGLSPNEMANILGLIPELARPFPDFWAKHHHAKSNSWKTEIEKGTTELYQSLFLSQLPNLRALTIGYNFDGDFHFLTTFMEFVLCSPAPPKTPGFRRLRQAAICIDMLDRDLNIFIGFHHALESVLPFFYLPALEIFRAVVPDPGLAEPGFVFAWPNLRPCASALTRLQLCRSEVGLKNLGRILSATPRLAHLEFDVCRKTGCGYFMEGAPYFKCSELNDALGHLTETLITLRLNLQMHDIDLWWDEPDIMRGLEGVTDFTKLGKLEDLELPLVLLLGPYQRSNTMFIQRLPPSLRTLTVNDDMAPFYAYPWRSRAVLKCLQSDLDEQPMDTSNFKNFNLCLRENTQDWDSDSQVKFCEIGLRAGFNSKIYKESRQII